MHGHCVAEDRPQGEPFTSIGPMRGVSESLARLTNEAPEEPVVRELAASSGRNQDLRVTSMGIPPTEALTQPFELGLKS